MSNISLEDLKEVEQNQSTEDTSNNDEEYQSDDDSYGDIDTDVDTTDEYSASMDEDYTEDVEPEDPENIKSGEDSDLIDLSKVATADDDSEDYELSSDDDDESDDSDDDEDYSKDNEDENTQDYDSSDDEDDDDLDEEEREVIETQQAIESIANSYFLSEEGHQDLDNAMLALKTLYITEASKDDIPKEVYEASLESASTCAGLKSYSTEADEAEKKGFFARIWDAIIGFIKKVAEKIGQFFKWIGKLFSDKEEEKIKNLEQAEDKLEESEDKLDVIQGLFSIIKGAGGLIKAGTEAIKDKQQVKKALREQQAEYDKWHVKLKLGIFEKYKVKKLIESDIKAKINSDPTNFPNRAKAAPEVFNDYLNKYNTLCDKFNDSLITAYEHDINLNLAISLKIIKYYPKSFLYGLDANKVIGIKNYIDDVRNNFNSCYNNFLTFAKKDRISYVDKTQSSRATDAHYDDTKQKNMATYGKKDESSFTTSAMGGTSSTITFKPYPAIDSTNTKPPALYNLNSGTDNIRVYRTFINSIVSENRHPLIWIEGNFSFTNSLDAVLSFSQSVQKNITEAKTEATKLNGVENTENGDETYNEIREFYKKRRLKDLEKSDQVNRDWYKGLANELNAMYTNFVGLSAAFGDPEDIQKTINDYSRVVEDFHKLFKALGDNDDKPRDNIKGVDRSVPNVELNYNRMVKLFQVIWNIFHTLLSTSLETYRAMGSEMNAFREQALKLAATFNARVGAVDAYDNYIANAKDLIIKLSILSKETGSDNPDNTIMKYKA